MDDCCSLWSCWQWDQQSHNAPWRDAGSRMPGTLCRLTPTDTLFSGRLVENTHTQAAGRRHKDTVDRVRTLIKTLKINVHLSLYPSGVVCGSQPLVHMQHKTTQRHRGKICPPSPSQTKELEPERSHRRLLYPKTVLQLEVWSQGPRDLNLGPGPELSFLEWGVDQLKSIYYVGLKCKEISDFHHLQS